MKSYNLKSPLINSNTTLNSKILFEGVTEKSDLTISGEIYEDLTKKNESDRYEYIFPNFNLSRNIETNLNGNLEFNHSGYNKIYKTNIRENVLINDMNYKSNDKIFKNGIISNYELLIKILMWSQIIQKNTITILIVIWVEFFNFIRNFH